MKRLFLLLTWLTMMLSTPGAFAAPPPAAIGYLVTNDDYGLGASDTAIQRWSISAGRGLEAGILRRAG